MGAARSVGLSGGARRLRVGDAAASRPDGAPRARRSSKRCRSNEPSSSSRRSVPRRWRPGPSGPGSWRLAMRSRVSSVCSSLAASLASARSCAVSAAPPKRKPLGPNEREAVLALVKAVDLAQATDTASDPALAWDHHVLKSGNYTGYVPFTLTTTTPAYKSTAMYVRAVSRHDGMRSSSEHSYVRDWLLQQPRRHAAAGGNGVRRHRRDADRRAGRRLVAAGDGGRPPRRRRRWRCSRRTWRSSSARRKRRSGRRRRASSIRCCFRSRSISSSTWATRAAASRGPSSGRWRCRPASTTSTSG